VIKKRNISIVIISIVAILVLLTCFTRTKQVEESLSPLQETGQIYLYGESHGVKKILDKEFELWYDYYHTQGMRHLFIEYPYYTAEFLNIWMQSDEDEILNELYADWEGTQAQVPEVKEFLQKIKMQCPETIFHGTDVGHQYQSAGKRFLEYLKKNNLEDSAQYTLTLEAIEQGKNYYKGPDHVYRENKMTENFIREFNNLSGENIMGIYGSAHTEIEAMDYSTQSIPCMANQLKALYGDALSTEDLSILSKDIDSYRTDTININGKDYKALYFGEQDITGFSKDYKSRAFWRLENAYTDFKNMPTKQNVLPYNNYPMLIEEEQVFIIEYTKEDNSVIREYHRSDGLIWNDLPTTQEFTIE